MDYRWPYQGLAEPPPGVLSTQPVTLDKWFRPTSQPQFRKLSVAVQIIDIGPPGSMITPPVVPELDGWFRPASIPTLPRQRPAEGFYARPLEPSLFVIPAMETWFRVHPDPLPRPRMRAISFYVETLRRLEHNLTGSIEATLTASAYLLLVNSMLDYDGANNGLFVHLGKLIKHYNLQRTDGRDLNTDLQDIVDKFQLGDQDLIIDGMPGQIENWKSEHINRREYLVGIGELRLAHREDVLEEIGAVTGDLLEVLPRLHRQMVADGESVQRCVVSIGLITEGDDNHTNAGTGRLLVTTLLDGITSPGRGPGGSYQPCPDYRGDRSELSHNESMQLVCSRDEAVDGVEEGKETFRWTGFPLNALHGLEDSFGSGDIFEFQVANAAALLENLSFDDAATAHTPDNWTISVGTAGTSFTLTTTAGEFWFGDQGIKVTAAGAGMTLTQAVPGLGTTVLGNKAYLVNVWCKAASAATTARVRLRFTGTGYTAATGTRQVQSWALGGTPTAGTYTITALGQESAAIDFDATAAAVQAVLRALPGLECVTVARSGVDPNFTYTVTMYNVQGNPPVFSSEDAALTGGTVGTHAIDTPGVESEEVDLTGAQLPTTWTPLHFFVVMPDTLPDDFALSLSCASPDVHVYLDDIAFDEVRYGGGVGVAIVRGTSQFAREDRFSFPVTNDNGGVIQKFFRDAWGFQLASSGSPTIADSLAVS